MLIACPNCKKRFELPPAGAAADKKLRCSNCRAVFRLVRKGESGAGRLKVVVANESAPFCEAVQALLSAEPFEIFVCHDGKQTLEMVGMVRPELLLLDVALPTLLGFEVCERIRRNPGLSGVKIVLVASVYDKTRYKRAPHSLYGADDYIEKHHIPDSLIPMIYRLARGGVPQPPAASESERSARSEAGSAIRQIDVQEISPVPAHRVVAEVAGLAPGQGAPVEGAPVEPSEEELKARRLARIIVSDIALYNQEKVARGVRDGSFYEILADDIREGELLYLQRVPRQVREHTAYLADAFEDLIDKTRRELRS